MSKRLEFEVFTLFPAAIDAFASSGILGRAEREGRLAVRTTNYRDFSDDKHCRVDDAPFGGGPGMTIRAQPVAAALAHVHAQRGPMHRVLLTPSAPTFDQAAASRLARLDRIALLCGRYEGIDDRVREHLVDECFSIGDYILNGGEVAAAVVIEAVARLRPGVLGNAASAEDESFGSSSLLEYPQYTRPPTFDGWTVPSVLLSGDHAAIARWRRMMAVRRTFELRPDLLDPPQPHHSHVVLPREAPSELALNERGTVRLWRWSGGRLTTEGLSMTPNSVRGLRDLRRRLRAHHDCEPAWVRVRIASGAARSDEATSVAMSIAMIDAVCGIGAPVVWVFDDIKESSWQPPNGFCAVLSWPPAQSGSGLAEPSRIEHPSQPITAPSTRTAIEAFALELAAMPVANSDSES
ncbi:MAG: tRNA (guanosine(37)-N1)-methyltransferase TrmD [Myxococcales bacterium FL481]|nr:MAG: tRNA (guanosine(37)-N1)-methyltransferase TrmD [Myxococcales bacterium FL481]